MKSKIKMTTFSSIVIMIISGVITFSYMFSANGIMGRVISVSNSNTSVQLKAGKTYYIYSKKDITTVEFTDAEIVTTFSEKNDGMYKVQGEYPVAKLTPLKPDVKITYKNNEKIWINFQTQENIFEFQRIDKSPILAISAHVLFISIVSTIILSIMLYRFRRRTKVANKKSGEELVFPNIK